MFLNQCYQFHEVFLYSFYSDVLMYIDEGTIHLLKTNKKLHSVSLLDQSFISIHVIQS
jgi:hypothetical protein